MSPKEAAAKEKELRAAAEVEKRRASAVKYSSFLSPMNEILGTLVGASREEVMKKVEQQYREGEEVAAFWTDQDGSLRFSMLAKQGEKIRSSQEYQLELEGNKVHVRSNEESFTVERGVNGQAFMQGLQKQRTSERAKWLYKHKLNGKVSEIVQSILPQFLTYYQSFVRGGLNREAFRLWAKKNRLSIMRTLHPDKRGEQLAGVDAAFKEEGEQLLASLYSLFSTVK